MGWIRGIMGRYSSAPAGIPPNGILRPGGIVLLAAGHSSRKIHRSVGMILIRRVLRQVSIPPLAAVAQSIWYPVRLASAR